MKSNTMTRRRFVVAGASATTGVVGFGGIRSVIATTVESATDRLTFMLSGKSYRFDTGALRGMLKKNGKSQGLHPIQEVASGKFLSKMPGILIPYRLLTYKTRFLPDARDWSSRSTLLPDGAVEVHWLPDNEHPLELKAVYRFSAPSVLDFRAIVKPQRELRKFELFLASYFMGFPKSFVYVQNPHAGEKPGFQEALKQAGYWQMSARDDEAERIIDDGRWNCPPNPVDWHMMPRLTAPLALRRNLENGLTVVLMAPAKDCFAVSTPYSEEEPHCSLYLSLFGCDLRANKAVSARARIFIGKNISDQQALDLYEIYQKDQG